MVNELQNESEKDKWIWEGAELDHLLFYADCVGVFFRLQMVVNPDIDKRASKLFQSIQSLTPATEIKLRLILHWIHGYYINQDPF